MNITFKDKCETVDEALSITNDRALELEHRMRLILHEYFRPTLDNKLPPTEQILKLFIALAKNEQELVFCAYMAGRKMEALFGYPTEYDDDDNDDDDEETFYRGF